MGEKVRERGEGMNSLDTVDVEKMVPLMGESST